MYAWWPVRKGSWFTVKNMIRACKIALFIKRAKVRKVDHAFLPGGIQIEDLTLGLLPCLVSQLAPFAELLIVSLVSIKF